jgi:hypothetical protein
MPNGELRKDPRLLKRPAQPTSVHLPRILARHVATIEPDSTGIRFHIPRHEIEDRGLTRAVRADQCRDGVRLDGERAAVDGVHRSERLAERLDLERGAHS